MKNLKIYIQTFALFLTMTMLSCDTKDDLPAQLSRSFSPIDFRATVNGNDVSFAWTQASGLSYVLEISPDAEFKTNVGTFQVGKAAQFTAENLANNTDYFARLKAKKENSKIEESKYVTVTFKTLVEQIFKETAQADITGNEILLTWDATKKVDRLVMSSANKPDVNLQLSSAEISEGKKLVSGLSYFNTYTFKLYLVDRLRGTTTITTIGSGFTPSVYVASHTATGSSLSNAIDGNDATYWQSAAVSKVYFILDLKKKYDVSKIVLKWDGMYFPRTYDIVYSNTPFTSLDAGSNLVGTTLTYTNAEGYGPVTTDINATFTAQYIAVQARGRNNTAPYAGTYYRLAEINVFGKPTP